MTGILNIADNIKKLWSVAILAAICAATLVLALPTITDNINDPELIVYFNADEGGLMDTAWTYFSGVKRDTFQWDYDHGLELSYVADIARLTIAKFTRVTAGTIVLILRIIHLSAWILSLIALWVMIGRHFGKGFQQVLCVLLLATRPALPYLLSSLKPEPLILLIMIVGFDYCLRILDERSIKNVCIAAAVASLAYIFKFAGLFLIPTIIAALYASKRLHGESEDCFPPISVSWIVPAAIGMAMAIFPLPLLFFYVRKSSGMTWCGEYGLWGSAVRNKLVLFIWAAALICIGASFAILLLRKAGGRILKAVSGFIDEIDSYAMRVGAIFVGFTVLLGFRWLISPERFISTYAQLGPISSREAIIGEVVRRSGMAHYFFVNLMERIIEADPVILALLVAYGIAEAVNWRENTASDRTRVYKRMVLAVFAAPFLAVIISPFKIAQHNMLPFFSVAAILGTSIIDCVRAGYNYNIRRLTICMVAVLCLFDAAYNGMFVAKERIYKWHQREDIVFDTIKWWRENIPADAVIVADIYNCVYIPAEYKNVKRLRWNDAGNAAALRDLIEQYKPRYVYYNQTPQRDVSFGTLETIAPDVRARLVKVFDAKDRPYKRRVMDRLLLYEIQKD
jgi:hypothetical protein